MKNMSNKLYEESDIQAIANAIRSKNGSSDTYTVSQMSSAIDNIPSGGGTPAINNGKNNFWVYIDTANTEVTATVETVGDTIDWGDSTVDTNTTHTYVNTGVYWIKGNSISTISGGNIIYAEYNNAVTLPSYSSNTTLKKVVLNNSSFTTLAANAFTGCTSLTEIDMPYITTISNGISNSSGTFNYCKKLKYINMPALTIIGDYAFYLCSSLNSFDFTNITYIGAEAFSGSSSSKATALTSVSLPSTITTLKLRAFRHNVNLTTVFIDCNIPNNNSSNGYIFNQCSALQSVTVGANVTVLGPAGASGIFAQTNNTWVMHLQGTTPPTTTGITNNNYAPTAIYVPASAVETYKNNSVWSTYASIIQAEPTA
jgi:hypothetical protein